MIKKKKKFSHKCNAFSRKKQINDFSRKKQQKETLKLKKEVFMKLIFV